MKKFVMTLGLIVLLLGLTACGSTSDTPAEESEAVVSEEEAEPTLTDTPPTDTPEPVVLATPTPRPAPPTPTPVPPTATPEPQEGESTDEAEATEEPSGPAVIGIMVEIPAGTFIMGSNSGNLEDAPPYEVDLPAYEIDRFEVTKLWRKI